MIVDDHTGFVQSCNWVTNTLTKARDYAVVTTSRHDVADLLEGFEADWHHGHSRRAAVRISSGVRAPGRASVSSSTTRSTGCGSRTNGSRTWR